MSETTNGAESVAEKLEAWAEGERQARTDAERRGDREGAELHGNRAANYQALADELLATAEDVELLGRNLDTDLVEVMHELRRSGGARDPVTVRDILDHLKMREFVEDRIERARRMAGR